MANPFFLSEGRDFLGEIQRNRARNASIRVDQARAGLLGLQQSSLLQQTQQRAQEQQRQEGLRRSRSQLFGAGLQQGQPQPGALIPIFQPGGLRESTQFREIFAADPKAATDFLDQLGAVTDKSKKEMIDFSAAALEISDPEVRNNFIRQQAGLLRDTGRNVEAETVLSLTEDPIDVQTEALNATAETGLALKDRLAKEKSQFKIEDIALPDGTVQKTVIDLTGQVEDRPIEDPVDPSKLDESEIFKRSIQIRKEIDQQTKVFVDIRGAFGRINAAQNNSVGDLALIFNFMKLLDPGSTVREGEFANAENAGGVPDKILNLYNKFQAGDRLTPKQRLSFKSQAKDLFSAQRKIARRIVNQRLSIAKRFGLSKKDVFGDVDFFVPDEELSISSLNDQQKLLLRKSGFDGNFPQEISLTPQQQTEFSALEAELGIQ